jgi:hypothetical protein
MRRYSVVLGCLCALLLLLVAPAYCGAQLTKSSLLDTYHSGAPQSQIIERINSEGVDFEITADVLQELRDGGLPRAVINALLSAADHGSSERTRTAAAPDDPVLRAKDLYQQGRVADAIGLLDNYSVSKPADLDAIRLLILLQIESKQGAAARNELSTLKARPQSEAVRALISQLEVLMSDYQLSPSDLARFKAELMNDLDSYRIADARTLIDNVFAEKPITAEVFKFNLSLYEARFTAAAASIRRVMAANSGDRNTAFALQSELTANVSEYRSLVDKINRYVYSPLTSGSCTPGEAREAAAQQRFSLSEFVSLVGNASRLFPLNPGFMDLTFEALLLTGPYSEVERVGDEVIAKKGQLRVPYFDRHRLFYLVIDGREHRVFSEENTAHSQNEAGNPEMLEGLPVDLKFDAVTGIRQNISSDRNVGALGTKSYVLAFAPSGMVPYYAFMPFIHCIYGEEANRAVARKLSNYLVHVMNNDRMHLSLVDPTRASRDWLSLTTKVSAVSTIIAAETSSALSNPNSPDSVYTELISEQAKESAFSALQADAQHLLALNQMVGSRSDREAFFSDLQSRSLKVLSLGSVSNRTKKIDELIAEIGK